MTRFEYTTLLQLIQENNNQIDEIIEQYILLLSQLTQTPMLSREIFMNNLYKLIKYYNEFIIRYEYEHHTK